MCFFSYCSRWQRLAILALLVAIVAVTARCGIMLPEAGYKPPPSFLYQDVYLNRTAPQPGELGSRSGQSCLTGYLWAWSSGNATVQTAAAAGGIRQVRAVEYRLTQVVAGGYTRLCTIVHGD